MRDGRKATECRFCKQPGELIKGVHPACKAAIDRVKIRAKRGIPPERWTASDAKTTCNTRPRNGKSYECVECRDARVKDTKRISHNLYMKRKRAGLASMPRPCKCGCGREVVGYRVKYASPECWPKNALRQPRVVRPASPEQKAWKAKAVTPSTRMPEKFVGTQVPQEPVVINPGVQVTRVASAMRHWRDTDEDLAAINRSFQARLDACRDA